MSHTINALTNAENRNHKIHSREYLHHKEEPEENYFHDGASLELDNDLLNGSFYQKRRLRRTARRLRYASSH